MSVELKDIIKEENIVYKKTPVLTENDVPMAWFTKLSRK